MAIRYKRNKRATTKRRTTTRRWTKRRAIPRLINKFFETKKCFASYTETALTSASTYPGIYVDGAMQVSQGTTMCQRIGNWVNGVGFKTRFVLHNNATDPQFIRYLILVNKQGSANTDYTTGASMFDNTSGTNTNLASFTTNGYLVRRVNKDKYTVLFDKIIRLGGSADRDKIYAFTRYISLAGRKFNYDGTSSVNPTQRNIVEVWLTAEADDDAVGQTVELTGEQTFYFKDG